MNTKKYFFRTDKIDIFKKKPEDLREQSENFALAALRNKNIEFSENHQFLDALIVEFNKKIKSRPEHVNEIVTLVRRMLTY
jgi:hypothetical protein